MCIELTGFLNKIRKFLIVCGTSKLQGENVISMKNHKRTPLLKRKCCTNL